jgi:hypothetical protein
MKKVSEPQRPQKAAGAGTRLGSGTTAPLAGKSKKLDNAM